MKSEIKVMLGILVSTIAIVSAAVFFFSKPTTQNSNQKFDTAILVREDSQKISSPSANLVLVEFGDFQCPACGAYQPLIKQLMSEFKSNLALVFRNFPLSQHKNALMTAYAAEAAGNQGKFWEMYDLLYEKQADWSESDKIRELVVGYAKSLELDTQKFSKDLDSDDIKQKINRDVADGYQVGVNSTPSFYLNGEKLQNPTSYEDFKTLVKAAILKTPVSQSLEEQYHAHFDFKVYLSGNPYDFTPEKYQSNEGKDLNEDIHLHDGNGELVHLHKKGVPLSVFFESMKMAFSPTCFQLDTGEKFCSDKTKVLKMLVNGKENKEFEKYVPHDLDRVLISYGSESAIQLQTQVKSVTDTACIYSLTCPERGSPPEENCVGGLGTGCDD